MSIELKQAAQQALEALHHAVPKDTKQAREQFDAIQALRTAIQQAESEPVANMPSQTHGMNLGERIKHVGGVVAYDGRVIFGSPMAVDALILQVLRDNHPAPGVPDDVVRDAERWRTFLSTRPSNTHEVVNAAIDAARLADKKGGAQ